MRRKKEESTTTKSKSSPTSLNIKDIFEDGDKERNVDVDINYEIRNCTERGLL